MHAALDGVIEPRVRRRIGRWAAGPVTMALMALGVLAPIGPTAVAAPADAAIRAAHLSPTTPGVDVYLNKFSGGRAATKLWLSAVSYGMVSPYQPLTPGIYTVSMRSAGAAPSSHAMLTWTLNAKPGAAYTVAGVGAGSAVRGVVIGDNLAGPPAGQGRVRIIQAASRAPVAEVSATGGNVIARAVRFSAVTTYRTLPAGSWQVTARSTSAPSVATTGAVQVRDGRTTSIVLLDAKTSGLALRTIVDSASSGVAPAGSVNAGGGGTARLVEDGATTHGRGWWPVWIVTAAAAWVVAMTARRSGVMRRGAGRHAAGPPAAGNGPSD